MIKTLSARKMRLYIECLVSSRDAMADRSDSSTAPSEGTDVLHSLSKELIMLLSLLKKCTES